MLLFIIFNEERRTFNYLDTDFFYSVEENIYFLK